MVVGNQPPPGPSRGTEPVAVSPDEEPPEPRKSARRWSRALVLLGGLVLGEGLFSFSGVPSVGAPPDGVAWGSALFLVGFLLLVADAVAVLSIGRENAVAVLVAAMVALVVAVLCYKATFLLGALRIALLVLGAVVLVFGLVRFFRARRGLRVR